MPLDLAQPPKLWVPSKPAIIRASDLPRSYAEAKDIKLGGVLPGIGPAAGVFASGGGNVALVDTIALATDVDGTTFTSNDVALTGSWTHLIILVSARNPTSVSGVTVEGNSATQVVVASDGTAVCVSAIYVIANSTPTPDIVVTWGASATTCHVQVFAVTGLQSTTAVATVNTGTANPSVLSLNTSAGGIAFAGGVCLNATSCAWSGVTETHDSVRETSFNFSGGYALTSTAESPRTITGTWSGTANYRVTVSASFR